MRLEIDSGGYVSACGEFYAANHGVVDVMSTLVGSLDGGGGMAGTDTGGEEFAGQYDQAASSLVQAGCDLGEALAVVANLLNASLVNHDAADKGALVHGPPIGSVDTGDHNPDHYGESLSSPAPPSAKGGTGDEPGWWHWIASHVGGLVWPDADTGRLRSVGDGWINAGTRLQGWTYSIDAARGAIAAQKSPEVPDALATCAELRGHVGDLATAFGRIGHACHDYADQVDAHHQEIEDELVSFIEWTVAIEAGGAVLGVLTLGIGEAAAQAAEAGEVANAAQKVIRVLNDLIELARLGAMKIGDLLSSIAEIGTKLKKILSARVIRALEQTGLRLGKIDLEALPEWAAKEGAIPEAGPGSELYQGFNEADRYGGLSRQEFYDKYWDAETGSWRYPPHDGFAGPAVPNELQPGQMIDRLGGEGGQYASPAGDAFGDRALPPSNIGRDYHQYEVLKPLPDSVTQGEIAPWFEQPGGGLQYHFDHPIQWYIDNGYLGVVH